MEQKMLKHQLGLFGRALALLLNRTMMYQKSHPLIKQSVSDLHKAAGLVFGSISPLVFILNREQFFIDEEPLDPRINVNRTVALFKNNGIQSVSFEKDLTESELYIFTEIFSKLSTASDAETIKKALAKRGVLNVKVNHVIYKKVTEDDQVVSRDALKNISPMMDAEDQEKRKRFMDTLLESVLTDEFANTLNITSLMANPGAVSKNIIEADLAGGLQAPDPLKRQVDGQSPQSDGQAGEGAGTGSGVGSGAGPGTPSGAEAGPLQGTGTEAGTAGGTGVVETSDSGPGIAGVGSAAGVSAAGTSPAPADSGQPGTAAASGDGSHGPLILHQIEMMHHEVEKHLKGEGDVALTDLAQAVFDMKRQLLEGIQAQKALGVAYANEAAIVEKTNQLTDQVLVGLIKEEYQEGKISTPRMAHIIKRLIPEAADLKRLLPQIKTALLQAGMPMAEYLNLIQELQQELEGDELARIFQESSEAIGLDGDTLMEEVKRNPDQAAELIYLASEIRKSGGDESALSDILVDYVEQVGSQMAAEAGDKDAAEGEAHLKKVMTDVETTVLKRLGEMNVNADVLTKMEERLNARMESVMDNMRVEWLQTQSGRVEKEQPAALTVLQTLEHNVSDDEELAAILMTVRAKVEGGTIDENDFGQIQKEISRQKKRLLDKAEGKEMPAGVLKADELMFILDKEVARAKRYEVPFSALAFAFVSAKPVVKSEENQITNEKVLDAALDECAQIFREVDYIGQIGKNKVVVLLPMTAHANSKKALHRAMKLLHAKPLDVDGIEVNLRVAGVAADFDPERKQDAQAFAKQLVNQLMDMVARLKNIQVLF